MPDLILIDGGTEQTSAAIGAMGDLGLSTAVFGMVKDDRHRTRALVAPSAFEVDISGDIELFSFNGGIQEETHRSAIEYQKSIRNEQFASVLDKIPGIGAKRKGLLIDRYKTVKAIKNASKDELMSLLPRDAAAAVYGYFHDDIQR